MGVATCLILICHSASWCKDLPLLIRKIFTLGYIGVDIFLLLSGIGLYYSWTQYKSNAKNYLLSWYYKRYKRILIPYLIIAIPIYTILCWIENQDLLTFISNVSTLSYWTSHQGAWYIAMLIPLYLFTPFFISVLTSKHNIIWLIILILCCYGLALISLIYSFIGKATLLNISFIIYRLPSYFLGIFSGPYIKQNILLSRKLVVSIVCFCLCLCIFMYAMNLPFEMFAAILLVISICFLLSKKNIVTNFVTKISISLGKISLESYLFNIFLPLILVKMNWDHLYPGINKGNYLMYGIVVLGGLGLSCLIGKLYTNKKKI